ncbi:MAG: RNA-binding S4 domain-containing protein [Cyclobacteriaceae bacterium]
MEKFKLREGEAFIELNKLLKNVGWAGTGGEAKLTITDGDIKVNDQVETQIRKKLRTGDEVIMGDDKIIIEA